MKKRKNWELAGYIAAAAAMLIPLVLFLSWQLIRFFGVFAPLSKYEMRDHSECVWVCETDTFSILIETQESGPSKAWLTPAGCEPIELTPSAEPIRRYCSYYEGDGAWYWSQDIEHPSEHNAPAVSFMPYYFFNGRYAVCLLVDSIYQEIAEKPFLIFKRVD